MGKAGPRGGRIVVGIDGSEASKDAFRWAFRQAELTGATLEAVTSWHMPTSYGAGLIPQGDYDPAADAESMLVKTVAEITGDNSQVTVETSIIEGPPALGLLKVADGAQLLVVGSRGHGAFTGMLLGSVSAHCVSHAKCPVVVVHHENISTQLGEPDKSPTVAAAS